MEGVSVNKVVYGGKTLIDLSQDTVTQNDVLPSASFHLPNGDIVNGTMTTFENLIGAIHSLNDTYIIPQGYQDGTGRISIADEEKENFIAKNIREGIEILGVIGTMSDIEGMKLANLTVVPTITEQIFVPTDLGDFNSINQVTVNPIPISEEDNDYGGKTVTIGIMGGE